MGWCSGVGNCLPQVGAWSFTQTGADLGHMLMQLDAALVDHFDRFNPSEVVYEAPIKTPHDKLQPLRKTFNLGGHLEFCCAKRGVPCSEVDLRAIKKELAGFSGAEKSDMVAAAEKIGVALPDGEGRKDAADAFGAWLVLLRNRNRAYSQAFDRALYGSRNSFLI